MLPISSWVRCVASAIAPSFVASAVVTSICPFNRRSCVAKNVCYYVVQYGTDLRLFQRGTGTRQVRASAQAVPIMAYTALYDPRHLHAHVSLSRDGSHYTYFPEDKDERTHIVTVPDGARPGQFAIIATPAGDDQ